MSESQPENVALELPGLRVEIDRVVYQQIDEPTDGRAHAFIYFITIKNLSDRAVTLLGRKWIIEHADGNKIVVEGNKIVQKTPRLEPGESFTYNSYHISDQNAAAEGAFHGLDELGGAVFTRIPRFEMNIPTDLN
ncbi:ApaG domain [Cerasicoccus maritimus]|uniref:ApaG domain-containing protein n=1 Tax=Cerasicoccus maritimus TaxID=490089 RepID=UPI0028527E7B|nr:ApaG domain [Cerasicoccus maritimus]